jgi:hypothetical protein
LKSSDSRGVKDWVNGASKCRTQQAGYSSAPALTNESIPDQAWRAHEEAVKSQPHGNVYKRLSFHS